MHFRFFSNFLSDKLLLILFLPMMSCFVSSQRGLIYLSLLKLILKYGCCSGERKLQNACYESKFFVKPICISHLAVQWCRRQGCRGASAPRKVSICQKIGQNPWKSEQKWHLMLFDFKKWRPTFEETQMNTFILEVAPKMVFAGENL